MSKSLTLKTITERMDDSSEEDDVEKEVAFHAKNFRKFLKMKNYRKPFSKGNFSSSKGDRKEFKKKDGKKFQSPQRIVCYECNGHGHLKKECPNYLRGKSKVFATTFSDFDSSNSTKAWLFLIFHSSTKTSLDTLKGCGKCLGYQPLECMEDPPTISLSILEPKDPHIACKEQSHEGPSIPKRTN